MVLVSSKSQLILFSCVCFYTLPFRSSFVYYVVWAKKKNDSLSETKDHLPFNETMVGFKHVLILMFTHWSSNEAYDLFECHLWLADPLFSYIEREPDLHAISPCKFPQTHAAPPCFSVFGIIIPIFEPFFSHRA